MVAAYRDPDRAAGRELMVALIDSLATSVPAALHELVTLARTLTKRSADVLAYFDRPRTSNGHTEAINGRLEHLRGSALGFTNLTNSIARSLLEAGGASDPTYTFDCEETVNAHGFDKWHYKRSTSTSNALEAAVRASSCVSQSKTAWPVGLQQSSRADSKTLLRIFIFSTRGNPKNSEPGSH